MGWECIHGAGRNRVETHTRNLYCQLHFTVEESSERELTLLLGFEEGLPITFPGFERPLQVAHTAKEIGSKRRWRGDAIARWGYGADPARGSSGV